MYQLSACRHGEGHLTEKHATIRAVSNRVHVRRHLVALLSLVQLHHLLRVDRQTLVRVDHNTEQP